MKTIDEVTVLIEEWAIDKGLDAADPTKQCMKLGEEFGELFEGMNKGNFPQVVDSIGDMYVVLTILALQFDIGIDFAIKTAYDEIKNRQGKTVNGMFIKESDL